MQGAPGVQDSDSSPPGPDVASLPTMGDMTVPLSVILFPTPKFRAPTRPFALGWGKGAGVCEGWVCGRHSSYPGQVKAGERAGERSMGKGPGGLSPAGPGGETRLFPGEPPKTSWPPGETSRGSHAPSRSRIRHGRYVCGLFNDPHPFSLQPSALVVGPVSVLVSLQLRASLPMDTLYPQGLQCLSFACIRAGTSKQKERMCGRKANPFVHSLIHSLGSPLLSYMEFPGLWRDPQLSETGVWARLGQRKN